ncbi:hypothetical protein [Burkholderia gladioli]|uniref:Non-hemolytic enterotoxin lytic component L1 n=1 Tax=Burkholderia gladioli (strain BSR3) TaxID=999541 RepID=F2LT24_BURGS|nr:hypothetical protein [Burkholderia gladioli]AEA65900.1 hypothetical protein bgla_4p1100 [Burkholderia gladioli BSR3]MBW5288156.1 hypothetical protein [Burkholderia gladioli]
MATVLPSFTDFQTTVTQYLSAIATMKAYTTDVTQCQIPSLITFESIDQKDYDDFTQKFSAMVTGAVTWLESVQPNLEALLSSLSQSSNLVNMEVSNSLKYAQLLESNPQDALSLENLNKSLVSCEDSLNQLKLFVSSTFESVNSNAGIIQNTAADLQQISTDISNMIAAYSTATDAINKALSNIEDEIGQLKSNEDAQNLMKIGTGAMLLIGFGLAMYGNPTGFTMFVGALINANQEENQIAMDDKTISSLQDQVSRLQKELNTDLAAYVSVQSTKKAVDSLTDGLKKLSAGQSLIDIEGFIQSAFNYLSDVNSEIQQAQKDEGRWGQVASDLQAAQAEWSRLQQYIGNMSSFTISYTPGVNNVVIRADS